MKLLPSQKKILVDKIENAEYNLKDFEIVEEKQICTIYVKSDKELRFRFSDTIQDAKYCDIYYLPTKKLECNHIFLSIHSFPEAIPYFEEWLECLASEIGIENKWNVTT